MAKDCTLRKLEEDSDSEDNALDRACTGHKKGQSNRVLSEYERTKQEKNKVILDQIRKDMNDDFLKEVASQAKKGKHKVQNLQTVEKMEKDDSSTHLKTSQYMPHNIKTFI